MVHMVTIKGECNKKNVNRYYKEYYHPKCLHWMPRVSHIWFQQPKSKRDLVVCSIHKKKMNVGINK